MKNLRWMAISMAAALLICACASQESADHNQEAMAVAAEPVEEEESMAAAGEEEADPGAARPVSPQQGDRCRYRDEEPEEDFFVDEESIHVQRCCDEAGDCLYEIYFVGGDKLLALSGDSIDETRFSPDGEFLMLQQSDESAHFVIPVDRLRILARDSDDRDDPIHSDELAEYAVWTLKSDELHRLEALSARAVDEADDKCDDGAHLPTLLELAKDAEPLSDRLDVEFEGWRSYSQIEMSTKTSENGATTMKVDIDSGCMERTLAGS